MSRGGRVTLVFKASQASRCAGLEGGGRVHPGGARKDQLLCVASSPVFEWKGK